MGQHADDLINYIIDGWFNDEIHNIKKHGSKQRNKNKMEEEEYYSELETRIYPKSTRKDIKVGDIVLKPTGTTPMEVIGFDQYNNAIALYCGSSFNDLLEDVKEGLTSGESEDLYNTYNYYNNNKSKNKPKFRLITSYLQINNNYSYDRLNKKQSKKLKTQIKQNSSNKEENHNERDNNMSNKENKMMNLAAYADENIVTVTVGIQENNSYRGNYTFLCQKELAKNLDKDSIVLAESMYGICVCKVKEIHDFADVNVEADYTYRWIFQSLDTESLDSFNKWQKNVAETLKGKERAARQRQVFEAMGMSNEDFPALPNIIKDVEETEVVSE